MMKTKKMIACHLDFKRAMWRRGYLDRFVERLSRWGYNAVVCEMEDKFRFAGHPAISHPTAWSPAETAAFAEHCRRRGLQVIPLMQSLGHLEFIVGKKEYAHLREAPELTAHVDVSNPASIPFLKGLFDEIIAAFRPAHYFHLGGDETWQLGNSRRLWPLMRRCGRGGLYLQHMRPLWEHIHRRGLTPIIWADMALTHPDMIGKIPQYVAMMDWNYYATAERMPGITVWGGFGRGNRHLTWEELRKQADASFRRNLMKYATDRQTGRDGALRAFYCTDALRDRKFEVLTAPANRCGGDSIGIPRSGTHIPNCYYFARKGAQQAAGTLVTSWAVRHNHPETNLPATFAAAWGLKQKGSFNQTAFWKAYSTAMFGAVLPGLAQAAALADTDAGLFFLEASFLEKIMPGLRAGRSPLKKITARLKQEHGGQDGARRRLEGVRRDYRAAAALFRRCRKQARCNVQNLDFWLEGLAVNDLLARLALAALTKSLGAEKGRLKRALVKARLQTGKLFSGTYMPLSVAEESALRYTLIEKTLSS